MTLFDPPADEPRELLGDPLSSAEYFPDFLPRSEAEALLAGLVAQLTWSRPTISFYGRTSLIPREVSWIAEDGLTYGYSGISTNPQRWPTILSPIRKQVEERSRTVFNSVLVNRYRDGNDTVGWHSDNERELGSCPVIASLSLGATRRFCFRNRVTKKTVDVNLESGSLVIMSGRCQLDWEHRIPRDKSVLGERLNLTFRTVFSRG
jgi:alkylated DNA repair dioxygenase AlkB